MRRSADACPAARQAQPATAIADAPRVLSQHVIMSSASEIKVEGEAAAPKASTMTVRPVDITSDDAPPAPQPGTFAWRDSAPELIRRAAVPAPPALVPPESAVSAYEDSYIYLASPSIQTHRFSLAREAPRRAETTPKKRSSCESVWPRMDSLSQPGSAHQSNPPFSSWRPERRRIAHTARSASRLAPRSSAMIVMVGCDCPRSCGCLSMFLSDCAHAMLAAYPERLCGSSKASKCPVDAVPRSLSKRCCLLCYGLYSPIARSL